MTVAKAARLGQLTPGMECFEVPRRVAELSYSEQQLREQVAKHEKLLTVEEQFDKLYAAIGEHPVLELDHDNRVDLAWATLGVAAGVISGGKAAELFHLHTLEWRNAQLELSDAMRVMRSQVADDLAMGIRAAAEECRRHDEEDGQP